MKLFAKDSDKLIDEIMATNLTHAIQINEAIIQRVVRSLEFEKPPKAKVDRFNVLIRRHADATGLLMSRTDAEADVGWLKQRTDFAGAVHNGEKLPSVDGWWNRDEWRNDFAEQREAIRLGLQKISAEAAATAREFWASVGKAIDKKLGFLEKTERSNAATVGLIWEPSTEYRTLHGVREFANRASKENALGASPATMLHGITLD
jgi:hypothetical protein